MGPICKCSSMDVLRVVEVLNCETLPQSHIFFDALIGGFWTWILDFGVEVSTLQDSGKLMEEEPGNFGNFQMKG